MSDPEDPAENFLQRWSRRKHAVETPASGGAEPSRRERTDADTDAPARDAAQSEADLPAFDPATLPPIDSISATSDIRAFLAPGVPEELTRAALRRVWVTDPTIRDFIGLAENQWDFTKPDGVPGFGSLELTPELRRMVAALTGNAPERATPQPHRDAKKGQIVEASEERAPPAAVWAPGEKDGSAKRSHPRTDLVTAADAATIPIQFASQNINDVATQKNMSDGRGSSRTAHRKHGGAMPK